MSRLRFTSLVVVVLLLAACASTPADSPGTSLSGAVSTSVPATTTSTVPGPTTTLQPVVLAPDFSLVLGNGETFTLSQADKPVYLLFWAEWCPVCRKEIPMIDRIAADFASEIEFVAPVWKSAEEYVLQAVDELMPSGVIQWGMDLEREIFALFQVPYQPVTILIDTDRQVVDAWAGVRSEDRIRAQLKELTSAPD